MKMRSIVRLIVIVISYSVLGISSVWAQEPPADTEISSVPVLPDTHYEYANISLPPHLNGASITNLINTPANNPITNSGATLGRVLFYDTSLSANNTIACASCHQQANGFSDPAQFSTGFEGGLTGRNSMGLTNARYFQPGTFFWDERAATLEAQVLMPIQDSVEMGMTLEDLVVKLGEKLYYLALFEAAFGDSTITSERIARALAQFVRAMVSSQTRFDEGVVSRFSNFTQQEIMGRQLFFGRGRCALCHTTNAFVATQSRNIGLDAVTVDQGLGAVTGNTTDNGNFKVPSLRNVALTAPYMHDGRFVTLGDVVNHYNNNIQNHANLDPILRLPNGQPVRLNLNQTEADALVAFLNTLTDEALINDEKFSDPFVVVTQGMSVAVYLPVIVR